MNCILADEESIVHPLRMAAIRNINVSNATFKNFATETLKKRFINE